ncbi:MAG: hypothetical protein M0Q12_06020 [Synergistaceae bacterium]|jgi:hypothetical protein|nr:hypothetical protein [Synergistaceae bacterium]
MNDDKLTIAGSIKNKLVFILKIYRYKMETVETIECLGYNTDNGWLCIKKIAEDGKSLVTILIPEIGIERVIVVEKVV